MHELNRLFLAVVVMIGLCSLAHAQIIPPTRTFGVKTSSITLREFPQAKAVPMPGKDVTVPSLSSRQRPVSRDTETEIVMPGYTGGTIIIRVRGSHELSRMAIEAAEKELSRQEQLARFHRDPFNPAHPGPIPFSLVPRKK